MSSLLDNMETDLADVSVERTEAVAAGEWTKEDEIEFKELVAHVDEVRNTLEECVVEEEQIEEIKHTEEEGQCYVDQTLVDFDNGDKERFEALEDEQCERHEAIETGTWTHEDEVFYQDFKAEIVDQQHAADQARAEYINDVYGQELIIE